MPMGSICKSSEKGGSGRADLVIFLSGPRGSGQLVAAAERRLGTWTWESLIYVPDNGDVDDAVWVAEPDERVETHAASTQ